MSEKRELQETLILPPAHGIQKPAYMLRSTRALGFPTRLSPQDFIAQEACGNISGCLHGAPWTSFECFSIRLHIVENPQKALNPENVMNVQEINYNRVSLFKH